MFELEDILELKNYISLSKLYETAKYSAQIGNEILKKITIKFKQFHLKVGKVIL